MPYHDEEHPGQPLWQSVLMFCCKGMIEGIMVILFFWLLVQVLFTKQLEVQLQILLLTGLIVFCLCLMLGCFLCWRSTRTLSSDPKERVTTPAPAPEDPAARPQAPPPLVPLAAAAAATTTTTATGQPYEELDGDILEYPSTSCSTCSEDVFASLTASPCARSSPRGSPLCLLPQPAERGRASLPSFPRLGLWSKTRRALERRCTVTGDQISYSERLRLTGPGGASPPTAEEPIPLASLYYGSGRPGPSAATGAGAGAGAGAGSNPWIHFTVAFSPEQRTLTITIHSLAGSSHRLEDVWAEGSLLPGAARASGRNDGLDSLDAQPQSLVLVLSVGSVEELRCGTLKLTLHTQHGPPRAEGSLLGELEVRCADKDWTAGHPVHFTKELSATKCARRMSVNSVEAASSSKPGLSCSPQIFAQLFILLQYQTLAHRVKAMVLKAAQLDSLSRWPAASGYQMVMNLHHEGKLISTKRTPGWNSPFLFDLPPGDLSHMHINLELVVMQNQSTVLGRVLIGSEAPEAGRAHWREMCSQGQVERAQWHTVQPEPL